jgi:hypothetical protein
MVHSKSRAGQHKLRPRRFRVGITSGPHYWVRKAFVGKGETAPLMPLMMRFFESGGQRQHAAFLALVFDQEPSSAHIRVFHLPFLLKMETREVSLSPRLIRFGSGKQEAMTTYHRNCQGFRAEIQNQI